MANQKKKDARKSRRMRPVGTVGSGSARIPDLRGQPLRFGPVRVLSSTPPILLSGIPYDGYLGIATAFAEKHGDVPAGFLIFPTWSIETEKLAARIREAHRQHRQRHPGHVIRYICNTEGEARLLQEAGEAAIFLNHKFFVSEDVFRPLPGVPAEFDAVYNARFVAGKRHELAAEIGKVAYVAYVEPQATRHNDFQTLWPATAARSPAHRLLNDLADGLPVAMTHVQVNEAINRATTGLLLSKVEGASYAAVEYLLAGLSVVSTESKGGRDVYFDSDYCIVCDDNPRAVREAVEALKARAIPREYIRSRTLAKLAPARQQFLALVEELREELGGVASPISEAWPFGETSGVPWDTFAHHLDDLERSQRRDLEAELGLETGALDEVQLQSNEIRAIMAEVARKPDCSLLVFGCGNDSPIWERINRSGHTAFLEDSPEWAERARRSLSAAAVHEVSYGTILSEWRELLTRPHDLEMDLPAEVAQRKWDVIVVDGPAGHRDHLPGRMKSIYNAARLAAPGGMVFVHDAERPVEAAYAARFLAGNGTASVRVRGRALLRGYRINDGPRDVSAAKQPTLSIGTADTDIKPPKLSFIVVNWNYGRYIGETLRSIRDQDYPHFECVVVDNGSEDDSTRVVDEFVAADPRFRLIELPKNVGQLGGVLAGLKETDAPFLALIDSDDVLLPNFASVHLQTHLALSSNVAITTSRVVEVNSHGNAMSHNSGGKKSPASAQLADAEVALRLSSISMTFYRETLASRVGSFPNDEGGWLWSPGTANVMRRSVVDLLVKRPPSELMRAADGFFLPLCHVLGGTAWIDLPLSQYRIHGNNYFATRETVAHLRRGNKESASRHMSDVYENLAVLVADASTYTLALGARYWPTLDRAARRSGRSERSFYRAKRGMQIFRRNAKRMRVALGTDNYLKHILPRFGLRDSVRLAKASFGGRLPVKAALKIGAEWTKTVWRELWNRRRKTRRRRH
jgi:uncharacterized protein (TIGR01627 family)